MFSVSIGAFIGAILGAIIGDIASRVMSPDLKNEEKSRTMIDGIVRPRPKTIQKRAPKANTDLIAYQKEVEEQGVMRG